MGADVEGGGGGAVWSECVDGDGIVVDDVRFEGGDGVIVAWP
jgi:hypothetical protein